MRRTVIVSAAVVVTLVVGAIFAQGIGLTTFGWWSFTKSIQVDRGIYFRLKVMLAYKGEPQDFDIVVGCNALQINYKDGSTTSEVGLVPTVYGRRMSDGKGLVVRPPRACDGETTANGKVPPNFMPVIGVFDDADTLAFGTAYISDEAYTSPLSELTFGGATIEAATRAEFDAVRRDGPPNLVTRESYFSLFQAPSIMAQEGLTPAWPPFARECHAYKRFRVPEDLRASLHAFWPAEQPRYWMPPTFELQKAALAPILKRRVAERDTGGPSLGFQEFSGNELMADLGVARSGGGGMLHMPAATPVAASIYPVGSDISADKSFPNKQVGRWHSITSIDGPIVLGSIDVQAGAKRGFAYCYQPYALTDDIRKRMDESDALLLTVDSETVAGSAQYNNTLFPTATVFERDEFFLMPYQFLIDSTRGDV